MLEVFLQPPSKTWILGYHCNFAVVHLEISDLALLASLQAAIKILIFFPIFLQDRWDAIEREGRILLSLCIENQGSGGILEVVLNK